MPTFGVGECVIPFVVIVIICLAWVIAAPAWMYAARQFKRWWKSDDNHDEDGRNEGR